LIFFDFILLIKIYFRFLKYFLGNHVEVIAAQLAAVFGGEPRVGVNGRTVADHQVRGDSGARVLAHVVDANLLEPLMIFFLNNQIN
jgi:hypothetical protein